jgi:hypothetical protein
MGTMFVITYSSGVSNDGDVMNEDIK